MTDGATQRGTEAGEGLLVLHGGVVVTRAEAEEHDPGYVVVGAGWSPPTRSSSRRTPRLHATGCWRPPGRG